LVFLSTIFPLTVPAYVLLETKNKVIKINDRNMFFTALIFGESNSLNKTCT